MEVAESILPGSLSRTLEAFEKQQTHDHKMDEAVIKLHATQQKLDASDSWKSYSLVIIFGAAIAGMLFKGMVVEASVFGGFLVSLGLLARLVRKKGD
jgi:uncharacterized membrane protein